MVRMSDLVRGVVREKPAPAEPAPAKRAAEARPAAPAPPAGVTPVERTRLSAGPLRTVAEVPRRVAPAEPEPVRLAAVVLVLVPFLDRRANRDQPSPAFMALGLGALMYMIAFTIIGYFAA